ncbi:tetraspanin-18-like isoform X1 [Scyliorhinus canicula]|uniref:tetraspanin-18-like isoform X1 n=2 Tax=Scyliorhinus canicula TaxID=7830 RepID=UPI0018F4DAC4|nr:tetraspanin-18-like isoform X1 [Scyliorhinus canicula]
MWRKVSFSNGFRRLYTAIKQRLPMADKMGRFEHVKHLMITLNILLCLSGLLLLILAFALMFHPTEIRHIVSLNTVIFFGTVYVVILSIVLLILGTLGIIAAYRETRTLLFLFFMLILAAFVVEFVAGICAFIFRFQLTKDHFDDDMVNYYSGNNVTSSYSASANSIMISFECCGVGGPKDFLRTLEFVIFNPQHEVPDACCKRMKPTPDGAIVNLEKCISGDVNFINNQGCFELIVNKVEVFLHGIGALNILILIIELCVMITAIWLYQRA